MNRYIMEILGTYFLVLTIALSGNPLAIGVVLTAMVYMGGYISGAHYNPAVTIAVLLRGKIHTGDAIKYILFQILGGLLTAFTYEVIQGNTFAPSPTATSSTSVFLIEMIYTFALALVVLHVATSDKVKGNYYYGLAIGFLVMAGAFSAGPISGGVFNPAVAIGPMLVDLNNLATHLNNLFIYITAPIVGGVLASFVYRLTTTEK